MKIVIDTNVWVSGLLKPGNAPGLVLRAIRDEKVVAVACLVHGVERTCQLQSERQRLLDGHGAAAGNVFVQGLAGQGFEHEEGDAVAGDSEIEEPDDVGVLDLGE